MSPVTTSERETSDRRRGRPPGESRLGSVPSSAPSKAELASQTERDRKLRADRTTAVTDAISLLEMPLAAAAAVEQRQIGTDQVGSLTLDIVALESHKPVLADALVDLAESYPVLGVVLDKLAKATPFGALIGVVTSLGVQIAENHRTLPAHLRGLSPNLVARDDLVEQLQAEAESRQNGARKVTDSPQA